MLKRATRDRHRPVKIVSVVLLFKLLDKFSEDKNAAAPAIFKTLIFSLVENPSDTTTRDLFYCNFI